MSSKFYEFNQNNSGGFFDVDENVCHRVIIEANNPKQIDKTIKHKWYHKKPFIIFVNIFKRLFY